MALAKNLNNHKKEVDIFDINYWKFTAESRGNVIKCLIAAIVVLCVGYFFLLQVGVAWDKQIDNQNTMLCNSALVSGNVEWHDKCETYYTTGNIRYLR